MCYKYMKMTHFIILLIAALTPGAEMQTAVMLECTPKSAHSYSHE